MKRLFIPLAALALCGCSLIPDNATTADAKKAVQAALTTYADVYQPAVIAYGNLPVCPSAPICHDKLVYAKLAAADSAVTKSITAAQAVLEGSASDTGQLTAALTAIQAAEATIGGSGVLAAKPY